jgi:hypothetical protein
MDLSRWAAFKTNTMGCRELFCNCHYFWKLGRCRRYIHDQLICVVVLFAMPYQRHSTNRKKTVCSISITEGIQVCTSLESMLQMTGVSCEAAVLARRCTDSFIDHYWATVTRHYSGAADSADKAHPHTLAAISLSVTLTLLRTWGVDSVEQTACQRLTVRAARFNSTIHHTTFF